MKRTASIVMAAVVLATIGANPLQAQDWWWGVSYGVAGAQQDTGDFVDATSWRNVGLDGRYMFTENVSAGFFAGWNVFHDDVEGTISFAGADISGFQSRYVNAVPLLATAHYYIRGSGGWSLFVGTGLGTYWVENRLEIGLTAVDQSEWYFGLAPEVGFAIPFGYGTDLFLSGKYNYMFEKDDIAPGYWSLSAGVAMGL